METIIKYAYNGQEVEFDLVKENVMVNATEMANAYDKRIDHFMRSEHAKTYIDSIIQPPFGGQIGINTMEDLVQNRGRNGLWMHRYFAIYFAMWLDPKFSVWISITIDKLMNDGANQRKALLGDTVRLKREIYELKEILKTNESYKQLVSKEAELLRLGKDLKENDRKASGGQMEIDI